MTTLHRRGLVVVMAKIPALVVSSVLAVAYMPISIALFWWHRNCEPIRSRRPSLVVLCSVALFINIVMDEIEEAFSTPLIVAWLVFYIVMCLAIQIIIARLFLLAFMNRLQRELMGGTSSTFFQTHRRWCTTRAILTGILAVQALQLLPGAVITISFPRYSFGPDMKARDFAWQDQFMFLFDTAVITVYALVIMIMGTMIRSVKDLFGIVREFKCIAVIGVLVAISNTVLELVFPVQGIEELGLDLVVDNLAVHGVFIVQIVMPLIASRSARWRSAPDVDAQSSDLERFLLTVAGRESFRTLLMKSFCLESLLFLDAVREFRMNPTEDAGRHVFRTFIIEGSPMQVNISGDHVAEISEVFGEAGAGMDTSKVSPMQVRYGAMLPVNLFDSAKLEVVQVMLTALLPQYIIDPVNADLWRDFQERNRERDLFLGPTPASTNQKQQPGTTAHHSVVHAVE
ncbi:unnamed protein product (mitochondrion) [Plasmodiophora brassicae]|uniref:RGS domain-containing protein n=2 Tax=Plasmodiophora brassicae TaxID=37360 RepID=A0A3P3Y1Q7_PLABS|nr:unnamed protein product [Plasmodiophora brassicae]